MTKRTKFCVYYSGKIARFSDHMDAMVYANSQSLRAPDLLIDVHDASGIIGQFCNGISTPEFRQHWHDAMRSARA